MYSFRLLVRDDSEAGANKTLMYNPLLGSWLNVVVVVTIRSLSDSQEQALYKKRNKIKRSVVGNSNVRAVRNAYIYKQKASISCRQLPQR